MLGTQENNNEIVNYLILSNKYWHQDYAAKLNEKNFYSKWFLINKKEDFNIEKLNQINPKKIFIPHWSSKIPESIYLNYECILFHMTDLPYGRGGSPLQNLIKLGHKRTIISAIKVVEEVDAGPIYLKKELELNGTAKEIFSRSSNIIFSMITEILRDLPTPQKQVGEVVHFKRRKPNQSKLTNLKSIDELYDHIRMLDCEGYPKAFIELENFKLEFEQSKIIDKNNLTATVNFKLVN